MLRLIYVWRLLLASLLPVIAKADLYPINKQIDIQHYVFALQLSDSTDMIIGKASVTVLLKQGGIKELRLDFINQTVARKQKGMLVENVYYKQSQLNYTHQNDALLIQLPAATKAGERITLVIQYRGIPYDALRIGPTKYGDRSFFCENWPNRARHWLPTYDHPSDKATVEFIVQAPAKYKVVSNGLLLEESLLGNGMKLTHWKQAVPVSCWLFVLGVAEFAVEYVDRFEHKSIETWVYAKDREKGFYDFREPTKQVLSFYTDYVGPFAYEKLANIQSPSVGGGMETSSAIFYAENLVNGKRDERTRNVVVHEIAHQWFGNAVTESSWDDVWLSEGFATFFTLLFIEHAYGKAAYVDGLLKAKKTVLDLTKKLPNHSIVSPRTAELEEVTNGLTYQKGAWVLHMLRNLIGEKAFQKGIRAYYARYFNASASTEQFRVEMEKASGKDLKKFFAQWLFQPVIPSLQVQWQVDASKQQLLVDIEQTHSSSIVFEAPIEIHYYLKGDTQPHKIQTQLKAKQQKVSIPVRHQVERIEFDPSHGLLSTVSISQR